MPRDISRRRAIAIIGLSAGLAASPRRLWAQGGPERLHWAGEALGAVSSIDLYHDDAQAGRALLADCVTEIRRLEAVFSLTRPDSALSRLNRQGHLANPPPELVAQLTDAARFSAASFGAFDATVQPLWTLYSGHFSRPNADPDGPAEASIAQARSLVDWQKVRIESGMVSFAQPGMGVTLNGIAGGYITDKVIDLLKSRGITRVLADLGEMRSMGRHPDGKPWHVGMADPNKPSTILRMLDLDDQAVGSSGGYGTVFDKAGRFHHLFVPGTGHCADFWAGTTVRAADAITADALSTALAAAPPHQAEAILRNGRGQTAWLVDRRGGVTEISA